MWLGFDLSRGCLPEYQVQWTVDGAVVSSPGGSGGEQIQIVLPDVGHHVSITVTILFRDGTKIFDTINVDPISQAQADWMSLLCRVLKERKFPNPWWEWDVEHLRPLLKDYDARARKVALSRTENLLTVLKRALESGE